MSDKGLKNYKTIQEQLPEVTRDYFHYLEKDNTIKSEEKPLRIIADAFIFDKLAKIYKDVSTARYLNKIARKHQPQKAALTPSKANTTLETTITTNGPQVITPLASNNSSQYTLEQISSELSIDITLLTEITTSLNLSFENPSKLTPSAYQTLKSYVEQIRS